MVWQEQEKRAEGRPTRSRPAQIQSDYGVTAPSGPDSRSEAGIPGSSHNGIMPPNIRENLVELRGAPSISFSQYIVFISIQIPKKAPKGLYIFRYSSATQNTRFHCRFGRRKLTLKRQMKRVE